jgi:hypothetical protein
MHEMRPETETGGTSKRSPVWRRSLDDDFVWTGILDVFVDFVVQTQLFCRRIIDSRARCVLGLRHQARHGGALSLAAAPGA